MRERTAAVVVNYNDSETTLAQIRRIRDYAALDRIIVVDNASTDRSLAALRAEGHSARGKEKRRLRRGQ